MTESAPTPPAPETLPEAHRKVLLTIVTERRFDMALARTLPPWDAILLAQVGWKAGVLARREVDKLVQEAKFDGHLKPYREPKGPRGH